MKVAVLMSTYNGERFLLEQLESLTKQKGCDIEIFIRDDGSKDKTVKLIEKFATNHKNIHIEKGENIGYTYSFLNLIFKVGTDFDHYAFCDQDDVWMPDKILTAVNYLDTEKKEALYCCKKIYTDENLKRLPIEDRSLPLNFEYGFFRGGACGCCFVWNNALQRKILLHKPTANFKSHDDYVRCLAIALNASTFLDEKKLIFYRRHSQNSSLIPGQRLKRIMLRGIKNFGSRKQLRIICDEILRGYEDSLPDKSKEILRSITAKDSLRSRINLCRINFKTIPAYEILFLRLMILFRGID